MTVFAFNRQPNWIEFRPRLPRFLAQLPPHDSAAYSRARAYTLANHYTAFTTGFTTGFTSV